VAFPEMMLLNEIFVAFGVGTSVGVGGCGVWMFRPDNVVGLTVAVFSASSWSFFF